MPDNKGCTREECAEAWKVLRADPSYIQLLKDAEPILTRLDAAKQEWYEYRMKLDKVEDEFFAKYFNDK